MEMNRREMVTGFSALAMLGTYLGAQTAEAQGGPAAGPDGKLAKSVVFHYNDLPVKTNANGGTGRQVFSGTLPTGEFVEVHETTLPPGQMPHPPHKHSHSEMLLIREGSLQFEDEGTPMLAGPGDVVFTATNRMHGLKNVGTVTANYFVVAVGVQTKE